MKFSYKLVKSIKELVDLVSKLLFLFIPVKIGTDEKYAIFLDEICWQSRIPVLWNIIIRSQVSSTLEIWGNLHMYFKITTSIRWKILWSCWKKNLYVRNIHITWEIYRKALQNITKTHVYHLKIKKMWKFFFLFWLKDFLECFNSPTWGSTVSFLLANMHRSVVWYFDANIYDNSIDTDSARSFSALQYSSYVYVEIAYPTNINLNYRDGLKV